MGLISSICKLGSKAVQYGKRALKVAPDFLLGETSEVVGKGMRYTKGSIFQKAKGGALALEKHVARASKRGNFFKRLWKGITSTPALFKDNIKQFGAVKGIFKTLSKKMPLIGSLLTIAFEIPNIVRAFSDGGIGAGMKEIFGAGIELGCISGGAAIGTAICPVVGTVVGGIVGSIVGMFVRGKTYTEKQEEQQQEEQAQDEQIQENQTQGQTETIQSQTPVQTPVQTPLAPTPVQTPLPFAPSPTTMNNFGFSNSICTPFSNSLDTMNLAYQNPFATSTFANPFSSQIQKPYKFQYLG